jgi:hypothetical protein
MGILAEAKMVTNSFGNRNLMQPMGRLSMHSKCLDFFVFKQIIPENFSISKNNSITTKPERYYHTWI